MFFSSDPDLRIIEGKVFGRAGNDHQAGSRGRTGNAKLQRAIRDPASELQHLRDRCRRRQCSATASEAVSYECRPRTAGALREDKSDHPMRCAMEAALRPVRTRAITISSARVEWTM